MTRYLMKTMIFGMTSFVIMMLCTSAFALSETLPCDNGDNNLTESEVALSVCTYMLGKGENSLDDIGDAAFVYTYWGGKPKEIVDYNGRKSTLYRPVERVITTNPDNTRMIIAMGCLDKLVATDEATIGSCILPRNAKNEKIVTYAWEKLKIEGKELDEIPKTNTRFDIDYETMYILKPDIVLDTTWYNRCDVVEEKVDAPCIVAGAGFTFEENYKHIQMIGNILDKKERAQELENYVRSKVDMINSVTSKIPEKDKPTVYFAPRGATKGFYDAVEGRDFTRTVNVYEPLTIAGGINLAKDNKGTNINVAPEQIVVWNPDVIFVAKGGWDTSSGVPFVMETEQLSNITAVKEKKVYDCFYPYCRGSPIDRDLLNMFYMAKRLHPEHFKNLDMEKEGNEVYRQLLGVDGLFTELADYQKFPKEVY